MKSFGIMMMCKLISVICETVYGRHINGLNRRMSELTFALTHSSLLLVVYAVEMNRKNPMEI